MAEQGRGFNSDTENFSPSYTSLLTETCKNLVSVIANKSAVSNELQVVPLSIRQILLKNNLTLSSLSSSSQCISALGHLLIQTNESNATISSNPSLYSSKHSKSLIIFVVLIACVSFISILGNLCLAKVLYSKRHRLIQTDRIVLCLALSELCLVLIDSPTEIYRFLSHSFTPEWLCPLHTFFEALLSSCIIFYHLLGAFDRFVYIHGHASSKTSFWSKCSRRISTKSGSIMVLILPIICSLPLAICNCFHANIFQTSPTSKICIVQYTHSLLIGLLISFYLLPLLFSFFLHGKLIYFIRTRHNQHYLTATAFILPTKRNNTVEFHYKRQPNKGSPHPHDRSLLQPKSSSRRHLHRTHTEILRSTTTTMAAGQSALIIPNTSSNSSQSSRSSTGTSSTSVTSPIVLYKINSQAKANANRTVLLLVLLLSFYVFCWAPYNIYTWCHAYFLTKSSSDHSVNNNLTSSSSSNDSTSKLSIDNLHADLRRIIYINYSLYLLSMISMCFSFLFYFSLNKQARHELSRFIGCLCPWIIQIGNGKSRRHYPKQPKELPYRARFSNQYPYKNDRIKNSPPSLLNNRHNPVKQMNYSQNDTSKRRVLNYGCQIQCCP